MFAGHFGIAVAVKGNGSNVPIWILLVGTQLMDIIFGIFFLLGIEKIGVPIENGMNNVYHANYSHSLIGAMFLSILGSWIANHFFGKKLEFC
ncbi:hypothetical protein MTP04_31760 [Lysinibacillus sp. PLM2]|nr:hypothetical protein MTP04_31760 [Lysinibacillus sp. PLM2]